MKILRLAAFCTGEARDDKRWWSKAGLSAVRLEREGGGRFGECLTAVRDVLHTKIDDLAPTRS